MSVDIEIQRARVRASLKKRRERLRAEKLCVDCGCEDIKPGHSLCKFCLEARRDRGKIAYAKKKVPRFSGFDNVEMKNEGAL